MEIDRLCAKMVPGLWWKRGAYKREPLFQETNVLVPDKNDYDNPLVYEVAATFNALGLKWLKSSRLAVFSNRTNT